MGATVTKSGWRLAAFLMLMLAATMLLGYQQTTLYLVSLWGNISEGEYAHGYLVLAISFYLIYINHNKLRLIAPCPDYRALVVLAMAVGFWLISSLLDVLVAQTVALLPILLAIVWLMVGTRITIVLLFPILYLVFALPVWFPLSPLLQDLTADVVFHIIREIRVPAFRSENMIVLSAGTLSIEESCSGLRYLIAALTLGTLYAYLNFQSLSARIGVVLVSALAAVLSNILRVFIVVYLGYKTNMQHPYVDDHLMLGWYLFGGIVFVLLFIDNRLAHVFPALHNKAPVVIAQQPEQTSCGKGVLHFVIMWLLATAIILAAPVVINHFNKPVSANAANKIILPEVIGDWRWNESLSDSWQPVYHGAKTIKQIFENNGKQITLYIGYYEQQMQGKELIFDLNFIANRDVWQYQYGRDQLIYTGDLAVKEQLLKNSKSERKLVWYQYHVAGEYTANRYIAKLLQISGLLTGKRESYVMAAAISADKNNIELAREGLADFYNEIQLILNNGDKLVIVENDYNSSAQSE